LLERANVPGPYVLAGHSFGGLYVLTYAAHYPQDVAGMVLVDSTNRASAARATIASPYDGGSYNALGRFSALVSSAARLGLGRLYGQIAPGDLPPQSQGEVLATVASASNLGSTFDEYVQANASGQEAAALRDFASKPLVVLTAGIGNDPIHSASQDQLATLSTNSAHRLIDSDHEGLINNEKGAAATTQAILDVVEAVKSHASLR
jgi:pimeloyl-ACP methyl ester carboxylesterase